MCQGLAVVAEKIENIWRVHAHEGVTSHDELLHLLREDLRDGVAPHIKFEVYFPMIINDDIQQDVAEKYYPKGWVENKFGKWCACPESVSAVAQYLNENQPLLNFNPQMLHRASLNDASLDGASLNDASLNDASLDGASLNRASLNRASLNDASLNRRTLITFWSEISVAIFEKMYINFELKTRAEIETIIQDAKEGGHQ